MAGWAGIEQAAGAFTSHDLTVVLLIGTLALIVCVAAVKLTASSGLPTLLIYLAVGVALGEDGLGIEFESAELTQVLGYAALVLILIEGGLTTKWSSIRRSVAPAAMLSTVGVVVSVAVVGVAARFLLDLPWTTALLVGAILSSTDAAAVFSVLRRVPLPRRLTGMLEAESGFNDAPVVILVTALSATAAQPDAAQSPFALAALAGLELLGGTVIGIGIGYVGGLFMRRVASSQSGLFSIGILSVAVLAYAVGTFVHASGFIACYLAALILGNMALPHRPAVRGFAESIGWLAQIGLFVLLGLVASPSGFASQIVPAIVIGLVLLLLARPLSVLVSLAPFRVGLRDQAFLSWAGLRGAVPVVLATVPAIHDVPDVDWLFDLVFVLVVIFTLVQAPTLPWVARLLGVTQADATRDLDVESLPLERLDADLIGVTVSEASLLHGVEVGELRLPKGANVTLVVRNGAGFVPTSQTVIHRGDDLLIVSTRKARDGAETRVRQVSKHGRLAGWLGPRQAAGNQPGRRRTYTP
ncbi:MULTISPECIES: potassium/proton antiporter [unclassified Janibacter]|uniref:potassium/proton antiporter n=1 Tax=unclassified Janibacter TaxID=2649294 RepID=UPI003D010436